MEYLPFAISPDSSYGHFSTIIGESSTWSIGDLGGRNVKKIGHARTQIDVVPYATTRNKYCK